MNNVARNPLSVTERTPRKTQHENPRKDLPKNKTVDNVFPINPIIHRIGIEYFRISKSVPLVGAINVPSISNVWLYEVIMSVSSPTDMYNIKYTSDEDTIEIHLVFCTYIR